LSRLLVGIGETKMNSHKTEILNLGKENGSSSTRTSISIRSSSNEFPVLLRRPAFSQQFSYNPLVCGGEIDAAVVGQSYTKQRKLF
jgi:hypothetical protein